MTEPIIVKGGADTYTNSLRATQNYGDANYVQVRSGERRGFTRPPLPNILGRTVSSATLYGHASGGGLVAQTLTLTTVTEHWTQGRVTAERQPAVGASTATAVIGALPGGSLVAWDVTDHLQAVADGTADYHGWRITTNATSIQAFYATQSGEPAWELHVALAGDSEEPSNLRPDGGGATQTAEPTLAWEFEDQEAFHVQVDTPAVGVDPDEVAPDFDTGWTTDPDPEFVLSASAYVAPASGPTFWRVRARDTDGNESDWSPWAEFTWAAMPTLVVDAPTGAVGDPAVTVLAHLTSGTVSQWEVWATGPDRSDVRHRSGVQTGAISYQIPLRNRDKRRIFVETKSSFLTGTEVGWIYLKVNDDVDRAVAVGEQPHLEAWIPVHFTTDGALVAPTNLQIIQSADGDPRLIWQWQMTDVPTKGFNLKVDGKTVEQVSIDDIAPTAGTYTYTDAGQVSPLRPHTLAVAAVSSGKASEPATRYHEHVVKGVWLIPDVDIEPVWLAGTAVSGFAQSDRTATYTPVKGAPVDITYDWEGFAGTFEGAVDSRHEDVWAALDRIEEFRKSRDRHARLVWGSQSIAVRVRDIHATSSENINASNLEHIVRFGFVQVGD